MIYVPDGEMTDAEKVCYDAGWLTPLQATTVSAALKACLEYLIVVTDPEDPDDLQLLDQVRAAQGCCLKADIQERTDG